MILFLGLFPTSTVTNYDDTLLTEEPMTKNEAIKNMTLKKEVFEKFSAITLYRLKKDIQEDRLIDVKDTRIYITLRSLATFFKTNVLKLLEKWEAEFDKNPKPLYADSDAFNSYFCTICLLFDCNVHPLSCRILPRAEFEKISVTKCLNDCHKTLEEKNKRENDNLPIKSIESDKKKVDSLSTIDGNISQLNTEQFSMLKKTINFFNFNSCEITKFFNLYYDANFKCSALSSIAKKYENPDTAHNTKLKGKTALSNYKIKHFEFYQPCSHSGSCYKSKNCLCYTNKTYCEKTCFCTQCDLLWGGCKCKNCFLNCSCRKLSRECTDECRCSNCPNSELGMNKEKSTYVAPSIVEGYGLFTTNDLLKNEFVIEYVGEIITNDEAERRGLFYEKRKLSYLFDLSNSSDCTKETIDATKIANKARFINHSKNANVIAKTVQVAGLKRIGFYTRRKIKSHEELFFDYRYKEEQKKNYQIKEI